ncbi:MAG: hypothetical protein KC656_25930, partial [Myxococcales bacterium]|nr:hypothetical protein [Myxococcales bacterium]
MLSTLAVTALAGTLEVEVVDDARVEVPGATVTVSGPLETAQSRVTDVAGSVRFEIPDGEGYVLQASHEALRTTTLRGVGIHGPTRMSLAMTGDDTVLPVHAEQGPKRGPLVLQHVPCHYHYHYAYGIPCPVS